MTQKETDLTLLMQLAERLKVDLGNPQCSVASGRKNARARNSDGSLEVAIRDGVNDVFIETPRGPGVQIKLVRPNDSYFALAPKDAFFAIDAYMPNSEPDHEIADCKGEMLNHHIATIYVNREGLVLDQSALTRAEDLLRQKNLKSRY